MKVKICCLIYILQLSSTDFITSQIKLRNVQNSKVYFLLYKEIKLFSFLTENYQQHENY